MHRAHTSTDTRTRTQRQTHIQVTNSVYEVWDREKKWVLCVFILHSVRHLRTNSNFKLRSHSIVHHFSDLDQHTQKQNAASKFLIKRIRRKVDKKHGMRNYDFVGCSFSISIVIPPFFGTKVRTAKFECLLKFNFKLKQKSSLATIVDRKKSEKFRMKHSLAEFISNAAVHLHWWLLWICMQRTHQLRDDVTEAAAVACMQCTKPQHMLWSVYWLFVFFFFLPFNV